MSPQTLADDYELEGRHDLRMARDGMAEVRNALSVFLEETKLRDEQYIALTEELQAIDEKANKSKGFKKKDALESTEMTAAELMAFIEKHSRQLWANKTASLLASADPGVCLHCTLLPVFDEVVACRKEVQSWFDLTGVAKELTSGCHDYDEMSDQVLVNGIISCRTLGGG